MTAGLPAKRKFFRRGVPQGPGDTSAGLARALVFSETRNRGIGGAGILRCLPMVLKCSETRLSEVWGHWDTVRTHAI